MQRNSAVKNGSDITLLSIIPISLGDERMPREEMGGVLRREGSTKLKYFYLGVD